MWDSGHPLNVSDRNAFQLVTLLCLVSRSNVQPFSAIFFCALSDTLLSAIWRRKARRLTGASNGENVFFEVASSRTARRVTHCSGLITLVDCTHTHRERAQFVLDMDQCTATDACVCVAVTPPTSDCAMSAWNRAITPSFRNTPAPPLGSYRRRLAQAATPAEQESLQQDAEMSAA